MDKKINKEDLHSYFKSSKIAMITSIILTILFFIILVTMIISSFLLLNNGPTVSQKKWALSMVIVTILLLIPYGILFYFSVKEIKINKKLKKAMQKIKNE